MSTISNSREIQEKSDTATLHIRQTYQEGVLPPSEELEKYALAHPDAVKTILEMATRQQQIDFELQKAHQERLEFIDRSNFELANKRVNMNGYFSFQIHFSVVPVSAGDGNRGASRERVYYIPNHATNCSFFLCVLCG